jgi:asparagine synthase (glutamine-hydrolysing)
MFAFALWDAGRSELILARDRFGKKPLYYAETGGGVIFGSELKSLLEHPDCPRDLDRAALSHYLAFEYVPEPGSIIAGVRKVPAAHVLTWRDGAASTRRYWRMGFEGPAPSVAEDEYVDRFRTVFRDAVGRRLISDVPLGAFLSGGVDSSSVVAAMTGLGGDVRTFSIGFVEPSFDESAHARSVARFLGTEHHEEVFTANAMLELLPAVAGVLDEPFADPSVLPTYLLSRFAREHVTVALGGDGGDELLAGYPTFPADRLARAYRVPRTVHERAIVPAVDLLPVSAANFSREFKLKRFLRGAAFPEDVRHAAWLGAFTPPEIHDVLVDPAGDPYAGLRRLVAEAPGRDRVERLISVYAETYLRDDILVKADRASMACSLEVRSPFLDVELVELLGQVPSSLKLRGMQTKVILKRAMRDALPPGIADRPKKGFGIPVTAWLRDGLRELLLDELSPARLRSQGLFKPSAVDRLVREHLDGRRDHRKALWTLLMFQLWEQSVAGRGVSMRSGDAAQPSAASR